MRLSTLIPSSETGGFLLWDSALSSLEEDPDEVDDLIAAVAFLGRYGGQSIAEVERMKPARMWRYVSAVAKLLNDEHSGMRSEDP